MLDVADGWRTVSADSDVVPLPPEVRHRYIRLCLLLADVLHHLIDICLRCHGITSPGLIVLGLERLERPQALVDLRRLAILIYFHSQGLVLEVRLLQLRARTGSFSAIEFIRIKDLGGHYFGIQLFGCIAAILVQSFVFFFFALQLESVLVGHLAVVGRVDGLLQRTQLFLAPDERVDIVCFNIRVGE